MIIIHVKIWTTLSTISENYPPQILPQFDNSMNSAARDKQQGSRLQGIYVVLNHSTSRMQILPPEKLYPPFQISTRQMPPFSSCRLIRPASMTLKDNGEVNVFEDTSDIRVDVVKRHIASGSVDDGVLVSEDGSLLHKSAPEDVEFGQDNLKKSKSRTSCLGKGRRMNTTGSDMENNEYPCDTMKISPTRNN
ncbi:hypothetical protein BYT27DRAFT_7201391 [Phlegmacium glaucopus]|nr:hypothetical protein BYT27DRAFT_7201391 [Phlegmacium glaucopus]